MNLNAHSPRFALSAFMTIYTISILLLLVLSYFELNVAMAPSTKKALTLFAYIFLVLQMGLRWETGVDWVNNLDIFDSITNFSTVSPSSMNPEYGYNIAVWLIKLVFSSYSIFLLIHAAVYYYLIFDSIKRYTGMLFLPLMIFYCSTIGYTGSSRELIAVAIGVYGYRYLRDDKRLYFYLLVGLASLFHFSAVILFVFPLFNRKMRLPVLLLLLVCAVAIGTSQLPQILFGAVGNVLGGFALLKADYYLAHSAGSVLESGLSIAGLLKRVMLLALFLYNRKALSRKLRYYDLMLNAYIVGGVLYVLFANSLPIVIGRGSMYFDMLEPLLLASQVHLLTLRSSRFVMATAMCVLSFFLFFKSIDLYPEWFIPYKGIFVNSDYIRQL